MPEKDGTGRLYDIDYTENYGWLCTAGLPIRDSAGSIHCYVLVDIAVHNLISGIRSFAVYLGGAIVLLTALIAWVLTKDMKRSVSDPINAIARAAEAYTEDRKSGAAVTDRFSSLNIRTGDEIENLSLTMADMERDLSEYVDQLTAVTAEKERIGTERMIEALNRQPDAAPEQLLQNVREAVDGFVRNAEQFDDLTMLCVEYKGGGGNG